MTEDVRCKDDEVMSDSRPTGPTSITPSNQERLLIERSAARLAVHNLKLNTIVTQMSKLRDDISLAQLEIKKKVEEMTERLKSMDVSSQKENAFRIQAQQEYFGVMSSILDAHGVPADQHTQYKVRMSSDEKLDIDSITKEP